MAAVRMGGAFACLEAGSRFQPSQGGVAGLVKALAREWPEVGCKVVDLGLATTNVAERLAAELESGDDQVEVGWSGERRISLALAPAPLPPGIGQPVMDVGDVLLVTGGARGITAAVTCELARRYRPTILVVGRSPLPGAEEADDVTGMSEPKALKAALAARLVHAGSPATVEPAYRRLLADREIRANLQAMTEAGAQVQYHQVDVRDAEHFAQFIEDAYIRQGRIDGVIHGAGVIEDKLVENKASDSFDRVMDTKAISAFVLARTLRPESLKFLVLFSSISARLGNPGQGDYAAANEVLNKLAAWLDARWPARVTALLWGPWERAGMVSGELERQFRDRGIQPIPPARGAAALIEELERGRKGDAEVVLGAGPWQATSAPPSLEGFPMLSDSTVTPTADGVEVTRMLDPRHDRYLSDHRLDGHPVLPAAAAMELMAEVAAAASPGHQVAELHDLRVLKGVILDDGPRLVTVRSTAARPIGGGVVVDVAITDDRTGKAAYQARVVLRSALPPAPQPPTRPSNALKPFPMPLEQAYEELLFHGPLLRGITRIEGIDGKGMVATLVPSSPQSCLAGAVAGSWIVDPVLIDSGFQLCLLWARVRLGVTPLPVRIRRYCRFAAVPGGPVRCDVRVQARAGGHILDTQFAFLDDQGHLLAVIEDMEGACSRSLNRLSGAITGGDRR